MPGNIYRSDKLYPRSGTFDKIYKDSDEIIVESRSKTLTDKLRELDNINSTQNTNIENNKYNINQNKNSIDNLREIFNQTVERLDNKNKDQDNKIETNRTNLANHIDDYRINIQRLDNKNISQDNALEVHRTDISNPHKTTKAQVGLGNCDNTADINKNVNSAKKLTNSVKIHGEIFDGTKDIDFEILHLGPTAPADKRIFWISTTGEAKGVPRYWDGSAWTLINLAW